MWVNIGGCKSDKGEDQWHTKAARVRISVMVKVSSRMQGSRIESRDLN